MTDGTIFANTPIYKGDKVKIGCTTRSRAYVRRMLPKVKSGEMDAYEAFVFGGVGGYHYSNYFSYSNLILEPGYPKLRRWAMAKKGKEK